MVRYVSCSISKDNFKFSSTVHLRKHCQNEERQYENKQTSLMKPKTTAGKNGEVEKRELK